MSTLQISINLSLSPMNFFLVVAGNTVVLMTFAYLFPQHNDDNGDQLSMSISIHLDMTSDILDRLTLLWKSYTLTRCGSQRPIVEDWKYVNVLIHGHLKTPFHNCWHYTFSCYSFNIYTFPKMEQIEILWSKQSDTENKLISRNLNHGFG